MGRDTSASEPTILSSLGEVDALLASRFGTWRLTGPIELQLLKRAPAVRNRLESRLNALVGACGCMEGSLAGAVTLLLVIAYWIRSGADLSWSGALAAAALVISAALAGKLAGVSIARIQLRRTLRDVRNRASTGAPYQARRALP
jgi:hypothetical protein